MRRWRWRDMSRSIDQVLWDHGTVDHVEWLESLDDEQPAGVDLSAQLWGC
jgi:hypothetical protein